MPTSAEVLGEEAHPLELAYGLAFSPATESPYLAYPFTRKGGVLTKDDDVWAAWDAGFGDWDLKVAEFEDNLASLSGLGFDCPSDDEFAWIPAGCALPRRPARRPPVSTTSTRSRRGATATRPASAPPTCCSRSWRRTSSASPPGRRAGCDLRTVRLRKRNGYPVPGTARRGAH